MEVRLHEFQFQESQLLVYYNNILNNLEEGNNIDSLYLDFQKAFNVVDLGILSHRLKQKGISGNIGIWLHNFLSERTQYVLVENKLSSVSYVTSGVPQGTVLGPILFLLLIDSMSEVETDAMILAFTDDSKVSLPILSETDVEN